MTDRIPKTVGELQQTLYEADLILRRAVLILPGEPYRTYVSEPEHAHLVIDDDDATLYWPESHSGYYDSCSIETQSFSFPSKLLLMSEDQIAAWHDEQGKKYEVERAAKSAREAAAAAIKREQEERVLLDALRKKYG